MHISPMTTRVYPGGCLIEGTNLSEGRGTTLPFEFVGAPWLAPRLPGSKPYQRYLGLAGNRDGRRVVDYRHPEGHGCRLCAAVDVGVHRDEKHIAADRVSYSHTHSDSSQSVESGS